MPNPNQEPNLRNALGSPPPQLTDEGMTDGNGAPLSKLFQQGQPIGVPASPALRRKIEFALASRGYALDLSIPINVIDSHESVRTPLVQCNGTLFVIKGQDLLEDFPLQNLPITRITPSSLLKFLPEEALRWVGERYGWIEQEDGWTGELLPLQIMALNHELFEGEGLQSSCVVAAPTSSGKSFITEIRMLARYFAPEDGKRKTVIMVPTREVGLEKMRAMSEAYGDGKGDRPGRLRIYYSDGEHGKDDQKIIDGEFDVVILVQEKIKQFIKAPKFLEEIGEVNFDELGATISDPSRGPYFELLLTFFASKQITVLGHTLLSQAAIAADRLLRETQGHSNFLIATQRPVAMDMAVWSAATQRAEVRDCNTRKKSSEEIYLGRNQKEIVTNLLLQAPCDGSNLLIAAPRKSDVLHLANLVHTICEERPDIAEKLAARVNPAQAQLETEFRILGNSGSHALLKRYLSCGIGIHTADLTASERELVDRLFRKRMMPVCISTNTLAYGINLPATAIVFMGWNATRGYREDNAPPFYRGLDIVS